jgi:hypothetical protein
LNLRTDERYSLEILDDKQEIFNVFKPISNGSVSKAIVAQYLAEILNREKEAGVDLKGTVCSDLFLKYIVDAICYVTEPINL